MTLRNLLQRKIELENKQIVKQQRLLLLQRPSLLSYPDIANSSPTQYQSLLKSELRSQNFLSILMLAKVRGLPAQLKQECEQRLRACMSKFSNRQVLVKISLYWRLFNLIEDFYRLEMDQQCQRLCSFLLLQATQIMHPLDYSFFKKYLANFRFETLIVLSQQSAVGKQDWVLALPSIKGLVLQEKVVLLEQLPADILKGQQIFLHELLCNAIFNQIQLTAAISLFHKTIPLGLPPRKAPALLEKLAAVQVQNKVSRLMCMQYLCQGEVQLQSKRLLRARLASWKSESIEEEQVSGRLALMTF